MTLQVRACVAGIKHWDYCSGLGRWGRKGNKKKKQSKRSGSPGLGKKETFLISHQINGILGFAGRDVWFSGLETVWDRFKVIAERGAAQPERSLRVGQRGLVDRSRTKGSPCLRFVAKGSGEFQRVTEIVVFRGKGVALQESPGFLPLCLCPPQRARGGG